MIATDGLQDVLDKAVAKAAFEEHLKGAAIFENPIALDQLLTKEFSDLIYDDTSLIFLQRKE